eukprot:GEZU01012409.1.p1 GENE.GEZU01012409.1~~GEZU01012409.1.p1  ORF type:complete len:213 (+),score=85.08 GEZU01012409.1:88-726(+)
MVVKVYVVFYSTYGHVYTLAEAIKKGAASVPGVEVSLFQVPETLPEEIVAKLGATEAKKAFAHIPVISAAQLAEADAIIFGTPTRFGNMAAQMKSFLDSTGQLWATGALVGKLASVFTSSATQHGGQESTQLSTIVPLLHHGLNIVPVPFACADLSNVKEMQGGSPYGATTITGGDGSRLPSEGELRIAEFQGKHVATLAAQLAAGKEALKN